MSKNLSDLRFVDIEVRSSEYQTGQQGSYSNSHWPAENVTKLSTKDSPQGAETPCIVPLICLAEGWCYCIPTRLGCTKDGLLRRLCLD